MFAYYKKIAGVFAGLVLLPMSLSISTSLWASELQDIKFAELPGNRVEIRLSFDTAPTQPAGYTIEQPARIVLDFSDVENMLQQKKFSMDMGDVNSAVVVAGGNRTRLIINMDSLAPYVTRQDGSDLIVEVGQGIDVSSTASATSAESSDTSDAAPSVESSSVVAKSSPKGRFDQMASSISNIDFRRGDDGEGKVIIQLTNPNVSVDVERVAGGLEIGFLQTELPEKYRRKLDVTDFATPVKMIAASKSDLRTVIGVDAIGDYDYLAYQADNEYVVSVKPLTFAELEEKKEKFKYTGEKLSLNFQNIEVRSVLQLIADFTELNLVASDTVKGSITLRLDNVPWDQALELVLKTKGLDKRQVGNVLMVAPAAEIAERERQELETKKQLEELAPLRTEYIRIRYANARELFDLFIPQEEGEGGGGAGDRNSTSSILSDRGQAIVDERTNSIILTDTEEKIAEFKKVIEQVDIPIRQVMIEARIVVANDNFRKELGSRLSGNAWAPTSNGNDHSFTGTFDGLYGGDDNLWIGGNYQYDANGDQLRPFDLDGSNLVNLSVTEPAGALSWNLISSKFFLALELTALQNENYAEIVSQPKVITGDKQQATISSGKQIPFQRAAASGATTVEFKDAVLKLDVTPQITPDDNIIMTLQINQDSLGQLLETRLGLLPTIDVTELQTEVLVGDGQTVVLGGIYTTEQSIGAQKVPLLGDIPILGRAFRKDTRDEVKRELIIFITPRIMSNTLTSE